MTDQSRTYTVVFTLPAGAPAPDGARPLGSAWFSGFTGAEFSSIPAVRAQIAAAGGSVVHENGARLSTPHDPQWSGSRLLLPAELSGDLSGVQQTTEPCPVCALPIATLSLTAPALAGGDPAVLAQSRTGVMLVATAVRERLAAAHLDDGAEFVAVSPGASAVLPRRRVRAGSGSSPACTECGRTTVEIDAVPTPVPARFAIAQSMATPPGEGWWFHPATGASIALVSGAVAALLIANGAALREQRVPDVTDAEAWLEEELR